MANLRVALVSCLMSAALGSLTASRSSSSLAREWLRTHENPDEAGMEELKATNPDAYAIVQALMTKKSLGLLNPRHPNAFGGYQGAAGAKGTMSTVTVEAPPQVSAVSTETQVTSHSDFFNWKPRDDDDSMVSNIEGGVASPKSETSPSSSSPAEVAQPQPETISQLGIFCVRLLRVLPANSSEAMEPNADNHIINPFESAFAIMKDLRAEVAQLRATMKSEQEKRDVEINELRGEVKLLKEELAKEQAERQADVQRMTGTNNAETAQRNEKIDKLRAEKNSEMAKLTGALEDEAKRAIHAQQDLLAKFDNENKERKADNDAFIRDLTEQKTRTEGWQSENTTWLTNINQDLKQIVGQLWHVDKAWRDFKYEGLSCVDGQLQKPQNAE